MTKTVFAARKLGKGHGMQTRLLSIAIFTLMIFMGMYQPSHAMTVALQWDANTESDLAGYKVYYKADSSTAPFDGTGATEGASPVDVQNQTTASISGLDPSHSYTFVVTAYNTSDMESGYSNLVIIPEALAPTVSLTSPANNSNLSGTVNLVAEASDNVGVTRVEYYVNNVLLATEATGPFVYTWDTTAVSPGAYTLNVRAYDAAGNVGQSGNINVTVMNDITPPAVAISSPTVDSTVSGTVTVTASATDNVGVNKVEFYENGVLRAAVNAAPYSYSWNTLAVTNGSYSLSARAYDNTGNSAQSTDVSVTVNNADSTMPTVAISSPSTSATVSGTVAVTANASDNIGVSRVEFYVNNVLQATDTTSSYSFSWSTTTVTNGSYTLSARAYDAAGNVGQSTNVSVTVNNADITMPTVAISSPSASATVSGTVAVTANATDNIGVSRVEFYVNNVLQSTDTSSPYSFSWSTTTVTNGSFALSARAYDATGNVGQSANVSVTVNNADSTIPTVAISSPSASATASGTVAVSANASDNIGVSRVEFYVNNVLQATDTTSPYSYSWNTAAVANGSYTLSAKAYDAAGNSAQTNLVVNVFNDLSAPVLTLNQVTSPTTLTTQTLSGTVNDNNAVASVTVQVGTKVPVAATISGSSWSYSLAGLVVGANSIIVRATDPAGNSTSLTATVTVESPPTALGIADAIYALQIAVGKIKPSSDQQSRLDVAPVINGISVPNGKVDTGDAIVILSKIVGKIVF